MEFTLQRVGGFQNCIVWGNRDQFGPQLLECSPPTYSGIEGWTGGSVGNLAAEPCFLSPSAGNYQLGAASRCIDAGEPGGGNLPERDVAGRPRIQYGGRQFAVDMGAYEFAILRCELMPAPPRTRLTWSSRANRSYSISWSSDLQNWSPSVPIASAGDTTTTWIDSISPETVPVRF